MEHSLCRAFNIFYDFSNWMMQICWLMLKCKRALINLVGRRKARAMQKEGRKFEKKKKESNNNNNKWFVKGVSEKYVDIYMSVKSRGYSIFNMQTWRQNARNSFWLGPRHSPLALIIDMLTYSRSTKPPPLPPPVLNYFILSFCCLSWSTGVITGRYVSQ